MLELTSHQAWIIFKGDLDGVEPIENKPKSDLVGFEAEGGDNDTFDYAVEVFISSNFFS